MTEISYDSKLLRAILQRSNLSEVKKKIFDEEISIPFELLKLGYHNSIWERREPKAYDKSADWLHIASFCEDERAEQFIEEAFFSEVRFKGDCLLAMWIKNPKKAQYWLDLIYEFDTLFDSLKFQKTKLVEKILSNFKCKENELFSRIYLSDDESKTEKLDKSVLKVLKTEVKFKEEFGKVDGSNAKAYNNTIREIREERELLISSNSLTEKQADKIFNALWESNIDLNNPEKELIQRTPQKVFVGRRDEDSGWGFSYSIEARQLIKLLPMLSKNELQKIVNLFDHLPFWMNLYRPLEIALYQFKSDKVCNEWKALLKTDLQIGDKRNSWAVGGGNERTQPTVDDLLYGLERIRELKDKELLISLINHYNGEVREKVQELLKESL